MGKTEQVPIPLPIASRNFPDVKTKNFGDNPISPFWEADGQDLDFFLKLSKTSKLFWHFRKNLLALSKKPNCLNSQF
jgi:hypothetical protein